MTTFRQSKSYDLLMGLPLMLWFGGAAVKLRPGLAALGGEILAGQASLHEGLLFVALCASLAFNLLLVWLVMVRTVPVARASGLTGRMLGIIGAFLGVAILYLPPAVPPPGWLLVSDLLLIGGFAGACVVLARLGRAFAILPEARILVTAGPYRFVRHPLYGAEIIAMLGNVILFRQPWAGLLAVMVIALQVARSHYEEQVLRNAFPEYAAYAARTKRFIPGII